MIKSSNFIYYLPIVGLLFLQLSSCRNPSAAVNAGKSVVDDIAVTTAKSVKGSGAAMTYDAAKGVSGAVSHAVPVGESALQLGSGVVAKLESKNGNNLVVEIWHGVNKVRRYISCSDKLEELTALNDPMITRICMSYIKYPR
jgi:hypothetical protein